MTVGELIQRLREMPEDLDVLVALNEFDRWDISHIDVGEMLDQGFSVTDLEDVDGYPVVDIYVTDEDGFT